MTSTLDTTQLFAIAAALGWASGLRLYAVVFLTGLAGHLGWVPLPAGLPCCSSRRCCGPARRCWRSSSSPTRCRGSTRCGTRCTPSSAFRPARRWPMACSAATRPAWASVAALLGGTLAATAHTAKATTRAAANTSPEPFSNLALSLAGDALVPGMLWLSWAHPVLVLLRAGRRAGGDGGRGGGCCSSLLRGLGAQAARALHADASRFERGRDVQEDPDRQPRRDRLPRRCHRTAPGRAHGRGLFRCRRQRAPCARLRRGGAHRRRAAARQLPALAAHPRRGEGHRRQAVHPGYGFLSENASSRRPAPMPAWSSSARRPARSARWAASRPRRH